MIRALTISGWKKWFLRFGLALIGAIALGYLPYRVYGGPGLGKLAALKRELAELEARNQAMRAENERLLREVRALRSDLRAIERVAREDLGLVRPFEIVFQFEEESETQEAQQGEVVH